MLGVNAVRTFRQGNVGIHVLANINNTLHDGLEGSVSNNIQFKTSQVGLEHNLKTTFSLDLHQIVIIAGT
jgi:hypothetical protein